MAFSSGGKSNQAWRIFLIIGILVLLASSFKESMQVLETPEKIVSAFPIDSMNAVVDSSIEMLQTSQEIGSAGSIVENSSIEMLRLSEELGSAMPTNSTFENSVGWLKSRGRNSNANETLMTFEYVQNLILNNDPNYGNVLKQTLCPEESTFMNWQSREEEKNLDFVKSLAARLIFLVLHEHQYGPARKEALARQRKTEKERLDFFRENKLGLFDYECDSDTKYLVVEFQTQGGFGQTVKKGYNPIQLGYSLGRVVIYKQFHRNANRLADCPRRDMQCMFLPMSPCVLELPNQTSSYRVITNEDFVKYYKYNISLSEELLSQRVLLYTPSGYDLAPPAHVKERYIEDISRLFVRLKRDFAVIDGGTDHPWNVDEELLEQVYALLRKKKWFVNKAPLLYQMRPNLKAQREVDRLMKKALPEDFDPDKSLGLAIRDGDKCRKESECMPFENYMEMLNEFSIKRTLARKSINVTDAQTNGTITNVTSLYDTIVLTSECKHMLDARFNFTHKVPFRFVVNEEDVAQGKGQAFIVKKIADEVMLASFVSFKLQMMSESAIVNGCSNFHRLILESRKIGCSKPKHYYTETLNQNDNPKFRMKCGMYIANI